MNLLGRLLDERDERRSNQTEAEERWLRERAGIDPAERLQSWDRWLRARLQAVELLTQRAAEVRQAKTETLRERQARLRARDAAAKADAAQPTLFGASAPDSLSNL